MAKELLESHFTFPPDATAHKLVRRLLSYANDADVRGIAHELDNLRELRNDADYRLSLPDVEDRKAAQHHVNNAAEQIRALKALASSTRWNMVLNEIRHKASVVSSPGPGIP